ncbi:hypothetical protein LIER_04567 [Lithospermum erythrorhizon]|uniref:Uncharacterized protein n=1 Tax=Lithospermum erythrorhizon TaxID=34254 RepID=A0AAV3NYI4_LITER
MLMEWKSISMVMIQRRKFVKGYLAHEFLSKGTLFGQPWDPTQAQAVPVLSSGSSRFKPAQISSRVNAGNKILDKTKNPASKTIDSLVSFGENKSLENTENQGNRHPPPLSLKPSLKPSPKPSPKPLSNNHLVAGYLGHEFLSMGTLFGQPWDPARAQAVPISTAGLSRFKPAQTELEPEKYVMYKEVTELMKTDGAHIPGIVNATQLGLFLQLR